MTVFRLHVVGADRGSPRQRALLETGETTAQQIRVFIPSGGSLPMVARHLQSHYGRSHSAHDSSLQLRLTPESTEILINPFGLLYHEIAASSLIKATISGEILDAGSTKLGINRVRIALSLNNLNPGGIRSAFRLAHGATGLALCHADAHGGGGCGELDEMRALADLPGGDARRTRRVLQFPGIALSRWAGRASFRAFSTTTARPSESRRRSGTRR
jgi:hypothetical protein